MLIQLLALLALFAAQTPPKPPEPAPPEQEPAEPVKEEPAFEKLTRLTSDGVTLTADFYSLPFGMDERPVFVCFHMENGSRAEFAKIAPRLNVYACFTMAVDLRTGKATDGVANETATSAASVLKKTAFTNEEAFADVVEALKWARELKPKSKIFALGSGTSAALVLVAAARDPACADAVFAFSPAEDVPGWSIAMEAKKITVPTYVTCDGTPQEAQRARMIGNSIDKKLRKMVIPTGMQGATRGAVVLVQPEIALRDSHWGTVVKMILQLAPTTPTPPAAPVTKDP
ncbi:MAG TPA: hypothetical protein VK843_03200 [Planctomycetota bacterium]|nr:hypothetical protein [Planctomycetota bacterium]